MTVGDPPGPGDAVYAWSPRRYVLAAAAVGGVAAAVGWFSASLLFSALAGRPGLPNAAGGVVFVGVYTLLFAAFSLLSTRGRPPALRFGGERLELTAERRDTVVVPYAAVSSAGTRWPWPVTMLEVFVDASAESEVTRLGRGGRRPLRKRKADRLRFAMPIAGLASTAADIRSQLRVRGLHE